MRIFDFCSVAGFLVFLNYFQTSCRLRADFCLLGRKTSTDSIPSTGEISQRRMQVNNSGLSQKMVVENIPKNIEIKPTCIRLSVLHEK